jgi:Bacterial transglutaminase-like N-terminal region
MIRLREGHDMRILDASVAVTSRADVHWAYDTFGNSIALLSFHAIAEELIITSELDTSKNQVCRAGPEGEGDMSSGLLGL